MSAPLPVPDEDTIWSLDALAALFQSPSLFGSHELPTIPDHTIHHDAQFNVFTEQAMLNTGCEMFMPLPESRAATVYDVSSNQILHACRRLPNTDNETLDSWLIACDDSEPKSYKCAWADCLAEPFEGRHKARIHIRKHLGINKLYECVVCHKQFVSHGTAKRHTNTQRKAFACKIWCELFRRSQILNIDVSSAITSLRGRTIGAYTNEDAPSATWLSLYRPALTLSLAMPRRNGHYYLMALEFIQ